MMNEILYRIAQPEDVEAVFDFESKKQSNPELSDIENKMLIWDSFYRKESLEHYFKTGWSFVAIDDQQRICGFFMGQALLFLDKQTQTLWVEHLSAINSEIFTELVDIAFRLSREKHFQRVLF